MTLTEFGYCPKCDERVELTPYDGGVHGAVLGCHKCGNLKVREQPP